MFSGFNNVRIVPSGNLAKASFVGANNVNGPSLLKVPTKSAAFTAATNIEKFSFETAMSAIVFPFSSAITSVATFFLIDSSLVVSFCAVLQANAITPVIASDNNFVDNFLIVVFYNFLLK